MFNRCLCIGLSLAFFLIFSAKRSYGQQPEGLTNNNWYFGNSDFSLFFSQPNNVPRLDSVQNIPFSSGGSAVATEVFSGNVFFYTDGQNVFDATNTVFQSALVPPLADANRNQSVGIAPEPGSDSTFYIFLNTGLAGSGVFVQEVNMNLAGNATLSPNQPRLGDLTGANFVAAADPITDAMLIIPGDSVTRNWLLVQDQASLNFVVYRIDAGGVFTQESTLTLPNSFEAHHFSYSRVNQQIAVAPSTPNFNVHIFDFNPGTGQLNLAAQDSVIANTAGQSGQIPAVFDAEFSPDGTKILVSRFTDNGLNGEVIQFDLANDSTAFIENAIGGSFFRSYGLRLAPDSSIYHLYQQSSGGPFLVGRFNQPNNVVDSIGYDSLAFALRDFQGVQFSEVSPPSTMMEFMGEIRSNALCLGTEAKFYLDVQPEPDSIQWLFDGAPVGFNGPNLVIPELTGVNDPLNVSAVLSRAGIPGDTISQTFMVADPGMTMVDLGMDTTICPGQLLTIPVTGTPLPSVGGAEGVQSIVWSTGEPNFNLSQIEVSDTTQIYWAAVTLNNGCVLTDEIEVEVFLEEEQVFNYWHFGTAAGINFNMFPGVMGPQPLIPTPPPSDPSDSLSVSDAFDAPEGSSSISDRNGDVLFYTDGQTVYNKRDEIMNGPDGVTPAVLGGSTGSAQSSVIVQLPNDQPLYYIFTTREVFDNANEYYLSYSVVDMRLDTANGQVVEQNVSLFKRSTERLTLFGGVGQDAWVIAHEFGNNNFRAYPITEMGIGNAVISAAGSVHSFGSELEGRGYMKLNGAGDLLAVALARSGQNFIELFNFDSNTGEITEAVSQIDAGPQGQIYGLEFSPGGTKLYASYIGGNSRLREFQIDSLNREYIEDVTNGLNFGNNIDFPAGFEYGAIQAGPDGQIYVAVNGQNALGVINPVEDSAQISTFTNGSFQLSMGSQSTLGLPNFSQQINTSPGMAAATVDGLCADPDLTTFMGNGTYSSDMFRFRIFDNSVDPPVLVPFPISQIGFSSETEYETALPAGSYFLSFEVSNPCAEMNPDFDGAQVYDGDTVLFTIDEVPDFEILAFDLTDVNRDPMDAITPAFCDSIILSPSIPDAPGFQYLWSTGATTREIRVASANLFTLSITAPSGCSKDTSVQVIDARPQVDIGPPTQGVCQNESFILQDVNNVPSSLTSFQWFIDGVEQTAATTNQFTVDTSTPGDFEYVLVVDSENPFDGSICSNSDTTLVTILAIPTISLAPGNPIQPTCGNPDGSVTVDVAPLGGNYSFDWRDASSSTISTNPFTLAGITGGSYSVIVTDNVSGCTNQLNINLDDSNADFTFVDGSETTCDPSIFPTLQIAPPTAGPFDMDIDVIIFTDQVTGNIITSGPFSANASNQISFDQLVPIGNYSVELTSSPVNGACIQSGTFDVILGPGPDIGYPEEVFICADDVDTGIDFNSGSTANLGFTWSPANLVVNDTVPAPGIDIDALNLDPANPTTTFDLTVDITDISSTPVLCDTSITVTVNVSLPPVLSIMEDEDPCDGVTTLTAVDATDVGVAAGNRSYIWRNAETEQILCPGGVGCQTLTITGPASGIFEVTVINTATGCLSSALDSVTVIPEFTNTIENTLACDNALPVILTVNSSDPVSTFDLFFLGAEEELNSNSGEFEVTEDGLYEVVITNSTGICIDTVSTDIFVELSEEIFISDTLFCSQDTDRPLDIDPQAPQGEYIWEFNSTELAGAGAVLNLPQDLPGSIIDASGLYSLSFTNAAGCTTEVPFFIEDDCTPRVIVPNAFSPNAGPGENRIFSIAPGSTDFGFIDPTGPFEVFIYSRWGELVFFSDNFQQFEEFGWNGQTENGEDAPAGTYSYFMRFQSEFFDGIFEQRGGVALIR
ncbi:MAG: gliding motility-associated C-terminal domain-containing protein [Bacteroidota bacterium]